MCWMGPINCTAFRSTYEDIAIWLYAESRRLLDLMISLFMTATYCHFEYAVLLFVNRGRTRLTKIGNALETCEDLDGYWVCSVRLVVIALLETSRKSYRLIL